MSVIFRILRKDIYRLRWDLAVYVACLTAVFVILARRVTVSGVVWGWFLGLQALLVVTISAQLVQADPLVGTTAFWRTRPIARGLLLAAKAGFALVFVVLLPGVAALFIARTNGLMWNDALLAGFIAGFSQAVLVFPSMVIAAFTATVPAFLLVMSVAVGATLLLHAWVGQLFRSWIEFDQASRTLVHLQMWMPWLTLLVIGLAVFPLQVLSLKLRRAVIVTALLLFVHVGATHGWQLDLLAKPARSFDIALFRGTVPQLQFRPDLVDVELDRMRPGPRNEMRQVVAGLTWPQLPDDVYARPAAVRSTFRLRNEDGQPQPTTLSHESGGMIAGRYEQRVRALTAALGGVRWLNRRETISNAAIVPVLRLAVEDARRLAGRIGRLEIQIDFDAATFRAIATAPLRSGARLVGPGQSMQISRAYLVGPAGAQTIICDIDRTMVRQIPSMFFHAGENVIRNSARREVLFAAVGRGQPFAFQPFVRAPFQLSVIKSAVMQTLMTQDASVDQDWLDGAEVVQLEPVPLGQFTLTVVVPDFVIPPPGDGA